jgi:hypothetical protein
MPAASNPFLRRKTRIDDDAIRREINRRIPWAIHGEVYSQQSFGTGPWPDQGWKLHVSATPQSAAGVLDAALDVLLAEGARFKVANSMDGLNALNAGDFGISQIGKFITAYPSDDAHAVRLAVALDDATRGGRGPRIPSDRPLRPDSLVHYRYGAMRPRPDFPDETSTDDYELLDRAGRLASDARLNFYVSPPGIEDPFEAAGAYVPRPAGGTLLNGRYLVIDALAQSPRGGVFRAVDLGPQIARVCLLKEFWHDVGHDRDGHDAWEWAANEVGVLSRHGGDGTVPNFIDSFEMDGNHYIATEYVEGTTLDRVLDEEGLLEEGAPPTLVAAVGLATAGILMRLHDAGIIFRDLKPAHVVKTPEGGYRLIDFGIAYELAGAGPAFPAGTPNFCSYEQCEGEVPAFADDIFAWGAVLHYAACGNASLVTPWSDIDRQRPFARERVSSLNPSFPKPMGSVIDRAVAWDRSGRFSTMSEARDALAAAVSMLHKRPATVRARRRGPAAEAPSREGLAAGDALRLASAVGDALCSAAEAHGGGLCWISRNELSEKRERSPHLYSGAAGIGLFLAELARATGVGRYADAAREAARWLAGPVWGRGCAQHGFHGGEPGVAFFFVRLAELLDEPHYVTAAELRMRRLHDAPIAVEDLIYGSAGTILSLVRLHAATGDSRYLAGARALGDQLAGAALPAPDGGAGCYWDIRAPEPGGGASPYLGLLHGSAGIGLALAELAEATNDDRYFRAARNAADLLLSQGRHRHIDQAEATACGLASLSGREAISWPRKLGDRPSGIQAHCHGAGGIGQFFVRLDRIASDARYRKAANGAAHAVAIRLSGDTRSCSCHGIAGTANLLLDCYQDYCGSYLVDIARQCGSKLECFRLPGEPGIYAMTVGGPVSPDLMLGNAGVGSVMLRLANPETARDLLLR